MSDEIDQTNDRVEIETDRHIAAIRAAAAEIPEGSGGICERCEEDSARLVFGHCARCRDTFNLR